MTYFKHHLWMKIETKKISLKAFAQLIFSISPYFEISSYGSIPWSIVNDHYSHEKNLNLYGWYISKMWFKIIKRFWRTWAITRLRHWNKMVLIQKHQASTRLPLFTRWEVFPLKSLSKFLHSIWFLPLWRCV